MVKISYEEFMKLSAKEKCIRYKDMNDNDRFKARVSESLGMPKAIGYIKLTKEQRLKGKKNDRKLIKIGNSSV